MEFGSCSAHLPLVIVFGLFIYPYILATRLDPSLPTLVLDHNDERGFVAKRKWYQRLRDDTSPQMMALVSQVEELSRHYYQAMIVAYSGRAWTRTTLQLRVVYTRVFHRGQRQGTQSCSGGLICNVLHFPFGSRAQGLTIRTCGAYFKKHLTCSAGVHRRPRMDDFQLS